ncbi:MAG: FAD-dependent oxidoreductase [Deltaproteobacteria bacterium]|jgi:2,4-dienoyl-CoA reductase-like NADH-dependent reductase (Old Yellow Enzyme family)/thioredoxin reductase|nr:FAD-dependent oxidoreductase [Deltaproteobacteria bacterium]
MMPFENLFSSCSIGSLKPENRLVMPPMATNYASSQGFVTERQIDYYVARARGGVGYITVEHTGILPQGKASPKMLLISSDEHESHIKRLVEALHAAGGKIVVQINHAGRQTFSAVTGSPIVGPSPIPALPNMETPHELSVAEIEALVHTYTAAAERVKRTGADGIEIHMAHGYLLCSFLSPFSNKREDQYGGDLAGRTRFPLEVLKSIRKRVGADFPIICRLSGDEYVEGGLKIEETKQIAGFLAKAGADALHISACNAASSYLNHPPYYVPEGVFGHLAEGVKSEVDIPVIAVGRIRNPAMADRFIREGKADLISMGRALIADPNMPKKARQGQLDDIIPCVSCNKCIQTLRADSVRCTVNPEAGNEGRFRLSKTERVKQVWVVGAGPGGLKAAEIAALRGHQVSVFEKDTKTGGRMRLGAKPPQKEVYNEFLDYLEKRIKTLGAGLELGRRFSEDMLDRQQPDAVVVATGARPQLPDWKGLVESQAVSVDDVLSDVSRVGRKVLIVGGGGSGAETADFLSEMGKEVTVVEMLENIASDLVNHMQHYLVQRLKEKGVTILTSTRALELGKGYATVEDASGVRRLNGFDTVVLAMGSMPNDDIYRRLEGRVSELYLIGDAVKPREIVDAVYEAEDVAIKI